MENRINEEKAAKKMATGTISCGFSFAIPATSLDDMELLDALVDLQEEDMTAVSVILKRLLGTQQRKALYAAIRREEDKTVHVEDAVAAMQEIFQEMGEQGKNS